MCANLRTDAVFQRRDNFPASSVVLRVRSEHEETIESHADRVSLNLHVSFLHDVEKAHLNFSGQVRQLVDSENSAIGAGKQAVVNGQFVGKISTAAGGFDGIDV